MNKRDIAPKDIIRLKEAVGVISKFTGNEICADCQYSRSLWASVNFGVFLCSECAGIHRGLGVHISQVRSVTLDDWTPAQVMSVLINGNFYVNRFLLKYNKHNRKLSPDMDPSSRTRFIQDKYETGRLGTRDGLLIVSRDTFPRLTVDAVISMFENSVELYNKGANHIELRYENIQNAGYSDMTSIPRDISAIYLRVPTIFTKKNSSSAIMKKAAIVTTPLSQQKQQQSPPKAQNEQLVDLDFGEMTSAAPVQTTKSSSIVEQNFVDFGVSVSAPSKTANGLNDIFAGLDIKDNSANLYNVASTKNDDWPTTTGSTNGNSFFQLNKNDNGFWPTQNQTSKSSTAEFNLFAEPKRTSPDLNKQQSLFNSNKSNTSTNVIAPNSDILFGDILSTVASNNSKPMKSHNQNGNCSNLSKSVDLSLFDSNNGCALMSNPVSSISFPPLNATTSPNNSNASGDDKDFILSLYR